MGWPVWQWRIAQQRKGIIQELLATVGPKRMHYDLLMDNAGDHTMGIHTLDLPYVRRQCGDFAIWKISLPHSLDPKQIERVASRFLESEIEVAVDSDQVRFVLIVDR